MLRSSLPHVDSWYIMDTGSDDDTIDIITRVTNEYPLIPGKAVLRLKELKIK